MWNFMIHFETSLPWRNFNELFKRRGIIQRASMVQKKIFASNIKSNLLRDDGYLNDESHWNPFRLYVSYDLVRQSAVDLYIFFSFPRRSKISNEVYKWESLTTLAIWFFFVWKMSFAIGTFLSTLQLILLPWMVSKRHLLTRLHFQFFFYQTSFYDFFLFTFKKTINY